MLVIANYVIDNMSEKDFNVPFAWIYEEIVQYAGHKFEDVKMPKFTWARKMIISELTDHGCFHEGEELTSEVLYRLKQLYYDDDLITDVIKNEYEVTRYNGNIIVCILKLPPEKILTKFIASVGVNRKKPIHDCKIETIKQICTRIKKRDPNNILAVIPEFNSMVYLNGSGKIKSGMDELDPLCDTLCMFVKNTPEGQALVERMSQMPPHSLISSPDDSDE